MIAKWAGDYVGVPYLAKGRSMAGLDCLGLLYLIYADHYGVRLPNYDHYTHENNRSIEAVFLNNIGEWTPTESRQAGALVMLSIGGYTTHLGVCIGDNRFIHAMQGCDVAIDSLDSFRWKDRIEGVYLWIT